MPRLTKSLVLIVWNELEGCKLDVPRLVRDGFDEVFAIDGGSTDGTVDYLQAQGIPVHRQRTRSLNAAYAEAVEWARSEAVVVFFPKGTIDPRHHGRILPIPGCGRWPRRRQPEHAGGSNEEDARMVKPRKWGVAALSLVASLLWRREGWRIRDVLHGVKGFTKDAYERMQISKTGVTVDLEMTVRAYRLRIPRIEFPVVEIPRPHGDTRFKIWPTGKRLARFLWDELFHSL